MNDENYATMALDDELTVSIEGENLNFETTPGSEEEWKRTIRILQCIADLDETESTEFEDVLSYVDDETEDVRQSLDSLNDQVEAVMDNFVSDEELASKLNDLHEQIEAIGSESPDDQAEIRDKIADMEKKVDVVYNDLARRMEEEQSRKELLEQTVRDKLKLKVQQLGKVPDSWASLAKEILRELHDDGKAEDWEHHRNVMNATEELRDRLEGEGDVEDADPLSEFRQKPAEEREQDILDVIRESGPIGVHEIGEELFGEKAETNSPEYTEIYNRLNSVRDKLEPEKDGRKTLYKISDDHSEDVEDESETDEAKPEESSTKEEPGPEEDDTDDVETEDDDTEETVSPSSTDEVEWTTISEAVSQYRDNKKLTFLINKDSKKSFKSISTPQAIAATSGAEDAEVWAAVRRLPEEFTR